MGQDSRLDVPFAAGVVGSLPRPRSVRDLLPADPGAESATASRSPQMNAAVRYAIAVQEMAGLDLVSDGEWRRHSYTNIIADVADGFEHYDAGGSPFGVAVTEPLQVKRPGLAADEARFLVESTDRATKVCLPSHYILGVRLWQRDVSARAYPTRESFMDAVAPILRDEIVALRDAGVSVIQIDEPELGVLVDPSSRAQFDDPQYEMDLAVDKINEMIFGIEGVRLALHLCRLNTRTRGWVWEGGYEPIIDAMKRVKVDQYVMEFTIPAAGSVDVIKQLPEDSLIGLGSVDCRSEHVDTPEEIVARVEEAMRYVEPERLSLNPDCGFAPDKSFDIPLNEAYSKLKNEAEAARRLRDKYA